MISPLSILTVVVSQLDMPNTTKTGQTFNNKSYCQIMCVEYGIFLKHKISHTHVQVNEYVKLLLAVSVEVQSGCHVSPMLAGTLTCCLLR